MHGHRTPGRNHCGRAPRQPTRDAHVVRLSSSKQQRECSTAIYTEPHTVAAPSVTWSTRVHVPGSKASARVRASCVRRACAGTRMDKHCTWCCTTRGTKLPNRGAYSSALGLLLAPTLPCRTYHSTHRGRGIAVYTPHCVRHMRKLVCYRLYVYRPCTPKCNRARQQASVPSPRLPPS